MNKREYLNDLIAESLIDRIYQRGEQSDHDPYGGAVVDGHHIVVTGYERCVHLLVDGEDWYIDLSKPRKRTNR